MALTSDDVVNWELKTGMRGYLVPQVDELLDEVADELDRLNARVRELEAEREAVRNSLDEQFEVEETLKRTLYQAQKAADQTIADARAAAEKLHSDASLEADDIVATATSEAARRIEEAIAAAEREGAMVRSRLQAQEAKMRAVGSQLRRNLVELHALERETRDLLRGVHEDRLRELDRSLVELPDFDEAEVAGQGFVDTPVDVEPSLDEPSLDEPSADDPSVEAELEPSADPPAPADVPVLEADPVDEDVSADSEDEAPLAEAASIDEVEADEDEVEDTASTGPTGQEPPYLSAVSDALATIATNQSEDRPVRRAGAPHLAAFDDDLLDDVDPVLADDPGLEHQGTEAARTPPTADLFGDQPPRRRRRSS